MSTGVSYATPERKSLSAQEPDRPQAMSDSAKKDTQRSLGLDAHSLLKSVNVNIQDASNRRRALSLEFHRLQANAAPGLKDAVAHCLAVSLCDEPYTLHNAACLGHPEPQWLYPTWRRYVDALLDDACNNGLSVVAVEIAPTASGATEAAAPLQVAGVLLCRDMAAPLPSALDALRDSKPLCHTMAMWEQLEGAYSRQCSDLLPSTPPPSPSLPLLSSTGKSAATTAGTMIHSELRAGVVVDCSLIGVYPHYRGHRLSEICTDEALKMARQHGFKRAVAKCSGAIGLKGCLSDGFKPLMAVKYDQHRCDGETPFAAQLPPSGPEGDAYITLVEKVL